MHEKPNWILLPYVSQLLVVLHKPFSGTTIFCGSHNGSEIHWSFMTHSKATPLFL